MLCGEIGKSGDWSCGESGESERVREWEDEKWESESEGGGWRVDGEEWIFKSKEWRINIIIDLLN